MTIGTAAVHQKTPGAGWFRAALQVNPYGYVGRPAPKDNYDDEKSYNTAILDECQRLGVSLIAITDHWKVSTAAGLIEAAQARGITALPGFEANCSEGFHLLVIFESGTSLDRITTFIGDCGTPDTDHDPHGPGEKSFAYISKAMAEKGALVIPAHVNVAESGLLAREKGKPLQNIVVSPDILALGTTPSRDPLGDQELILRNTKPYSRPHPLVEIYADDVSDPSTLSSQGSTSWFKMAKPSLRGLQHALRTPQTRVRLSPPPPLRGTRLRELTWTGGFLDGVTIPIGPELTALIGGRGTGKSTVIESLRYVLNQPPQGANAVKDHESVVQKVLGPGAVVSLEVEVHEPTPARYVIKRTVGDPPIVLDASKTKVQLLPADIVGEIEAFGQHELAEMAQNKNLLADLIRRLGGESESETDRLRLMDTLKKNRLELVEVEGLIESLETELAAIPRLEEQARKFEETDLGSKLEAQRQINDEETILNEHTRKISSAADRLAEAGLQSIVDELGVKIETDAEGDRLAHLETAQAAVASLRDTIKAALTQMTTGLTVAHQAVERSKEAWALVVQPDLEAHAATTRALVEAGYDPDAYLKTSGALKSLTLRAEERKKLETRLQGLLSDRQRILGNLAVVDSDIATELNSAVKAANAVTLGKVNVRPIPSPDRTTIKAVIDSRFKTARTQIMAAIDDPGFSVRTFVQGLRAGGTSLASYGITGAQATNLLVHGEPLFRELEEHSVGLAVDVYLNVSPTGTDFRRLEDLSKGQRATALLLLLLGVTKVPLVIDQPEDDLDNRFVFDGIVQHLRQLKGIRQILVSTHNANVPVLGDAELVIVLESDGHRGSTATDGIGSLDESAIRDFAEKILEGGEEAFRARRHLYGF